MPPVCSRILITCIHSVRSFTTQWPYQRTRWKKHLKRKGESHASSGLHHLAGAAAITGPDWKASGILFIQTWAGSKNWWLYVSGWWTHGRMGKMEYQILYAFVPAILLCTCVRVCMRACVRVHACVRACVRACFNWPFSSWTWVKIIIDFH